jgi:hypothetical protein
LKINSKIQKKHFQDRLFRKQGRSPYIDNRGMLCVGLRVRIHDTLQRDFHDRPHWFMMNLQTIDYWNNFPVLNIDFRIMKSSIPLIYPENSKFKLNIILYINPIFRIFCWTNDSFIFWSSRFGNQNENKSQKLAMITRLLCCYNTFLILIIFI